MNIHEKALCETEDIGKNTQVWAFAHILPGAKIGDDCNVWVGGFMESKVVIGDRLTFNGGVQFWAGWELGKEVFWGPTLPFTQDKLPVPKYIRAVF